MSHGSARLTVHGRRLIVQRHQAGWKQAHIAAAMGVSRKCVKTWIDRYAAEGEAGLLTRSSRPHAMPTKTSDEVEQRVLAARGEHRDGPDVLGPRVGVPARTVTRILRRHRVPYLRECDPMTGEVIRSSKQTAIRYERARPGELVHMDVKKLGRIPPGGGWKAHGRATANRDRKTKTKTKTGYDYVHSLVDDHTRLAYSEVLPDEKGPTCAAFLQRAAVYFAAKGIDRIERVVPDEGASGVVVAQGGAFGGWSMYLHDGRPVYYYNFFGIERHKVVGADPLPAGEHQVRAEFDYDGGGLGKGATVTLYVDGDAVGDMRMEHTVPIAFSLDETLDVGSDTATPVSDDYTSAGSRLRGRVRWVQLDIDDAAGDPDHYVSGEDRYRIDMARQ